MLGNIFNRANKTSDNLEKQARRAANIAQEQREQAARTMAATNALLEQATRARA